MQQHVHHNKRNPYGSQEHQNQRLACPAAADPPAAITAAAVPMAAIEPGVVESNRLGLSPDMGGLGGRTLEEDAFDG